MSDSGGKRKEGGAKRTDGTNRESENIGQGLSPFGIAVRRRIAVAIPQTIRKGLALFQQGITGASLSRAIRDPPPRAPVGDKHLNCQDYAKWLSLKRRGCNAPTNARIGIIHFLGSARILELINDGVPHFNHRRFTV